MKNKKVLIPVIIIVAILLCVLGYFTYFYMHRAEQEALLVTQASTLGNLNLLTDEVDMSITTTGDYAIVESAMKTCLKDYSDLCLDLENFNENSGIDKLITSETYQTDGPEFTNTKNTLNQYQTELNKKIGNLIEKCNKDSIMEYIQKENLDSYYTNLYEKLMFDDDTIKSLEDAKSHMQTAKDYINDLFDSMLNIFDYLSANKSKWFAQNGQLYFYDNNTLAEYNNLIDDLNQKISAMESFDDAE